MTDNLKEKSIFRSLVIRKTSKRSSILLARVVLTGAILIFSSIACSKSTTTINLIGENQTLPMPFFSARNKNASGELPNFAQIRVYEITPKCSLEDCPIVWDVVVSEKHSPNEFAYGGFPGFGAQTIIAAKPLKPNKRYLILTMPDTFGSQKGRGQLYFTVTEDGRVVAE